MTFRAATKMQPTEIEEEVRNAKEIESEGETELSIESGSDLKYSPFHLSIPSIESDFKPKFSLSSLHRLSSMIKNLLGTETNVGLLSIVESQLPTDPTSESVTVPKMVLTAKKASTVEKVDWDRMMRQLVGEKVDWAHMLRQLVNTVNVPILEMDISSDDE